MPSFAIPTALSIPLAWGLYSLMFLQWKDLMLDLVSPLAIKSFKYPSLSVATSIFKPPTPISFKTEAIDLISLSRFPVMTTIPIIPVWIIKITRILQYFPATKVKSAAIEVSAGLWSSPPSWWRLLAGVLPRACTQESQPLSYGQWPRALCCRKRLPSKWGSSKSSEKSDAGSWGMTSFLSPKSEGMASSLSCSGVGTYPLSSPSSCGGPSRSISTGKPLTCSWFTSSMAHTKWRPSMNSSVKLPPACSSWGSHKATDEATVSLLPVSVVLVLGSCWIIRQT